MGAVFQDQQPFLLGEIADRLHLAGQTEQVDHLDGPGVLGQTLLGVLQVEIQRPRMVVDEDRHQTEEPHRQDAEPGVEAGDQDLAAGRQIQAEQARGQGAGAVHVRLAVRRLEVLLPVLFKCLDLGVAGTADDGIDGFAFLIAEQRPRGGAAGRRGHGLPAAVDGQRFHPRRPGGRWASQIHPGRDCPAGCEKLAARIPPCRLVDFPWHDSSPREKWVRTKKEPSQPSVSPGCPGRKAGLLLTPGGVKK